MASAWCNMHQDPAAWGAKTSPMKQMRNRNVSPPSSTPVPLPFPTHHKTSQLTQRLLTRKRPIATIPQTRARRRDKNKKKKKCKE